MQDIDEETYQRILAELSPPPSPKAEWAPAYEDEEAWIRWQLDTMHRCREQVVARRRAQMWGGSIERYLPYEPRPVRRSF